MKRKKTRPINRRSAVVAGRVFASERDAWLESRDGGECLRFPTSVEFLRNRLKMAFYAGWIARENLPYET